MKPVLGILAAVLAVLAVQHLGLLPALSEGESATGGWTGSPAFLRGVLSLSGIRAAPKAAGEPAAPSSQGTLAPQETASPKETLAPQTFSPKETEGPQRPEDPVRATDGPPPVPEVDPYAAWIGGPYSPPSASDPEAKRLIEVTLLPSASGGYDHNGTVFLKNRVADPLDVDAILARPSILRPSDGGQPQVLIVHTHGSESYFPDERDFYIPSDIQRTEDTRFNVVRVGERIAEGLRAHGLNVLHDQTICDSPSYSGSYTKSLGIIRRHIEENPSIQVVIDVHRDSLVSENGTAYKAVTDTERGKTAQLMFVMGSNLNGLDHPNWLDNLSLAFHIQQAAQETYPALMRPMTLRRERYNQHASPGSCILEVGTAWNTLQEALLAAELFSETAGPLLAERLLNA
ncbi:MAG: stage II sporulation protein P [Oscillospiraceae bacterium]|nr:stage II sporulation protein P [Oscillospiraceae bacterium]